MLRDKTLDQKNVAPAKSLKKPYSGVVASKSIFFFNIYTLYLHTNSVNKEKKTFKNPLILLTVQRHFFIHVEPS